MEWTFRSDLPIYSQLMEQLGAAIICGVYVPGEKLPSVRDIALDAGVNPNTVQRALTDLEREGLVFSQRTAGRFVTENTEMIRNAHFRMADRCVREFVGSMKKLGCGIDEIRQILSEYQEEDKEE